ncbi:Hypothetical protein PHPALM_10361 [Phytophthora palmivora]|uniref:Uncharacterized protein n=1 Tax=Phytophthora palmivora TaxID=4796 RepID=A0A2P4Y4W4_9STRA|nr:Hypothetical protein PHPALM_10361 [Phytophthora palmivora]
MAAGRGASTRGGRGGRERVEVSRQSRRVQELPPPEQESQEEVERAARKANAAKRQAALEAKRASAETQTAVQDDAHQVSEDGESESKPKTVEGESGLDEPDPASVGGANVEEPRVVGRVSDSSPPVQDVSLEVSSSVQVASLPPVPEEMTVRGVEVHAEQTRDQPEVRVSREYAASQVARWEQEQSGQISPPSVEYTWPEVLPDSLAWMNAALTTSKYLAVRTAAEEVARPWVEEMAPVRRDLATAQDLAGAQVPLGMLSPREYVAILQTLLSQAGFQFRNVIPEWFQAQVSKISPEAVQSATFSVQLASEDQARTEGVPVLEYHAEDEDGDLLMSDMAVLGRLRLRTAGLRSVRSPSGSSIGEPSSKRPQHHPPRPEDLLASLPSQLPSSGTPTRDDASRGTSSDPIPSLVGTSDVSSLEVTSGSAGSYVSRNSSSSSGASAFGHSALTHMPSVGYGAMTMTVQGPSVSAVEGGGTG